MYTQSITRTHRTAIILAIDGSGSMAEKIRFRNRQMTKAKAVATITNGMLFELIACFVLGLPLVKALDKAQVAKRFGL